ncbi:LANO_0F04016g1_1 [Lachancea nothofagi CBS 11611]|uniref:LANO_0F04016g1_1 n=1 Tax=Lachancea nothofagi CBS 11611 TaxID=1266666 RepID=A0A1G4K7D5_9SACH|nr:LANO_0F04016g1_1 [Lachancea nothofagi CBS 11611]
MASLYHISTEVKTTIRKFRTATARSDVLKALVLKIEPKPSYEITIDDDEELQDASSLEELGEELPDNTPRYVLLCYPMTTPDGRKQTPLVLLYWKPATVVSQEWKMLYAGALELMRTECGVSRVIEVATSLEDEDEIQEVREQIES